MDRKWNRRAFLRTAGARIHDDFATWRPSRIMVNDDEAVPMIG